MTQSEIGSLTAKGGFINERDVCLKFSNFKNDSVSQDWLSVMGYDYKKIEHIDAIHIPTRINMNKALQLGVTEELFEQTIKYKKADVQIRVKIFIDNILYTENISLKKANSDAGYNQVDKRPVSNYKKMWGFNNNIEKTLKLFTGELSPSDIYTSTQIDKLKDKRRLFLTELPEKDVCELIAFIDNNKILIINDILKGRGALSVEWFLVTKKESEHSVEWILKDINNVCNHYAQGNTEVSPRGSLRIGRVTMQRKGGTPDPRSLQFKINPLELFDE